MWQTLAQLAIPIAIDQGIKYLTRENSSQPVTNSPNQQSGWTSNTVGINPDYKTGSSQYLDSLTPEQRQNLQRAMNDSGLNNQRFSDQSPGWEYRTGGTWQSPSGNAGGTYSQTQSGYNTISNPNLPVNNQNIPNQKPGIYNDLLRPVVRETGGQLAREATGYFTSGETGPLLNLLSKGATYLAGAL
ncbi:MAG TPA: hypothetical protein V6C58_25755 [Allocoleopsis sp.]